jgi:hypothetical protein
MPRILAMMLVLAVATASQAFGQAAPGAKSDARHGVGLGFGQVMVMGDLGTPFSNHVGFNVNYSFEAGSRFGLLVNLHVNSHNNPDNPDDSLSLKGLMPNLNVKLMTWDLLTFSVFGGLGAYSISETVSGHSASFFQFAMDAGAMLAVDLDPHFRFGPSFTVIDISSGTETLSATDLASGVTPLKTGGLMFELFFNLMYFF